MDKKIETKIRYFMAMSRLQIVAAVVLFVIAAINCVYEHYDVAFWQFLLGIYCILFYRGDKRYWYLIGRYVECLGNNDFLYDFGKLMKAKADFFEGKITREELAKIGFEFNLKHHVWTNEDLKRSKQQYKEETK